MRRKKALSLGIVCAVAGAIAFSLFPPLILGKIIDSLTAGQSVSIGMAGLYFALLALAGLLESLREGGLTLFGQKITHALRSRLMGKMVRLSADTLSHIEPGALVSRFVGDVDAVENLFTSGIVSMFADACRIISILAVVWFQNRGLALILVLLLPFLFWFTRHVQKNMLAAQLDNRRAVSRAAGVMCPNRCITSAPSTPWARKLTWSSATTITSRIAIAPWKRRISTTRSTLR